jgi:cytochrome c
MAPMDSLEINKLCAAVLVAGITFFVGGLIGQTLVHPEALKKTAIEIDIPQAPGAVAPKADPPIALLLASADPKKGEALTQQVGCVACHTFTEGGPAGVGPNLYGVVGGPHAHMVGFDYSAALRAHKGPWTYAALYEWLKKPSAYAPGTKMTFAGLDDPQKRADIIDYLHTLSHSPVPIPPVPKVAAAAAGPGAATPISFDAMVAAADPKKGQADTMRLGCVACHTFTQGGPAGVGPNLYGVVGGPHAHMVGFDYSAALKAHKGPWTLDELNKWLTKPSAYAPGTKMTFAGIPEEAERAQVVAYLRSLSASPVPIKTP